MPSRVRDRFQLGSKDAPAQPSPSSRQEADSSFGAGHPGPNKAADTMPERKEKAQLLQDEESAQLSVKQPGEDEIPLNVPPLEGLLSGTGAPPARVLFSCSAASLAKEQ